MAGVLEKGRMGFVVSISSVETHWYREDQEEDKKNQYL